MATTAKGVETFTNPEGALKRLRISDRMPVPPAVASEGSRILFDFSSLKPYASVKPPNDLLEEFLNVHTDGDLVQFAKQFGPLALFPTASAKITWPDPERLADICDPHYEKLSDWRRTQQQMTSVFTLMMSLRQNKTPTIEALAEFNTSVGGTFVEPKVLGGAKRGLQTRARSRLRCGPRNRHWRLSFKMPSQHPDLLAGACPCRVR
jgi:hypothetical protein